MTNRVCDQYHLVVCWAVDAHEAYRFVEHRSVLLVSAFQDRAHPAEPLDDGYGGRTIDLWLVGTERIQLAPQGCAFRTDLER